MSRLTLGPPWLSLVCAAGLIPFKDEPDWDVEEEEPVAAPKPLDVPAVCKQDEVLGRVMELLEEQRLHRQALIAKTEEESVRPTFKEEALAAVMGPTPLAVLPLLAEASAGTVLQVRDREGMTVLHHAARATRPAAVDACIQLCSHLADQLTPSGRPAHWSPLMVCVDTGSGGGGGPQREWHDRSPHGVQQGDDLHRQAHRLWHLQQGRRGPLGLRPGFEHA